MEYLDANIIIYALLDETNKGITSKNLLSSGEFITNTLTIDEVAFICLEKRKKEDALRLIREITSAPNIIFKQFSQEDFEEFFNLIEIGLKPRDAIHAATAIKSGCKIIYSEDKDFDAIKALKRKTPW